MYHIKLLIFSYPYLLRHDFLLIIFLYIEDTTLRKASTYQSFNFFVTLLLLFLDTDIFINLPRLHYLLWTFGISSSLLSTAFTTIDRYIHYYLFWITHPTMGIWVHYPKEMYIFFWGKNNIWKYQYLFFVRCTYTCLYIVCKCKNTDTFI